MSYWVVGEDSVVYVDILRDVVNENIGCDFTQVDEKFSEVDLANGEFVEFIGRSSASSSSAAAAASGGLDRWSGFEYTPVHLSYRYCD